MEECQIPKLEIMEDEMNSESVGLHPSIFPPCPFKACKSQILEINLERKKPNLSSDHYLSFELIFLQVSMSHMRLNLFPSGPVGADLFHHLQR